MSGFIPECATCRSKRAGLIEIDGILLCPDCIEYEVESLRHEVEQLREEAVEWKNIAACEGGLYVKESSRADNVSWKPRTSYNAGWARP